MLKPASLIGMITKIVEPLKCHLSFCTVKLLAVLVLKQEWYSEMDMNDVA